MTRPLSTPLEAVIQEPNTAPIYLIEMGWETGSVDPPYLRIATWGSDIEWGSLVWTASSARVQGLTVNGGQLILPNGEDDPWLTLVTEEIPRGRSIDIYEYHDPDAAWIFSGIMDEAFLDTQISIRLIEGLLNKRFPPTSFNTTDFPHLMTGGDRLYWGPDIVLIE